MTEDEAFFVNSNQYIYRCLCSLSLPVQLMLGLAARVRVNFFVEDSHDLSSSRKRPLNGGVSCMLFQ